MNLNAIITTVYGIPITGNDVVENLKVAGTFRKSVYKLIEREVLKAKVQEYKITYSSTEYAQFLSSKRAESNLATKDNLDRFCKLNGVSPEIWEDHIATLFYKELIKKYVVTPVTIKTYFQQNKNLFASLKLSRIVVNDKPTIDAIHKTCLSGTTSFASLAKQYSLDENTRNIGGSLGFVQYGNVPSELGPDAFSCEKGTLCGPYCKSGLWILYKIIDKRLPELTPTLEESIAHMLFSGWLKKHVQEAAA